MTSDTKLLQNKRRVLNVTGLRVTNQRALILEIIRRGHFDAGEIYHQARVKQPRLSLSTVYRTLRMFKELGLVEELHFDETHHHYEMKPSSEHQHLVCLGCGKVVEFSYPLSPKMKKDVTQEKGFEVTGVEIRMTGYCSRCQQNRK
ncbi:Fur family transcriptional regulator [Chloroflexota bacterium]